MVGRGGSDGRVSLATVADAAGVSIATVSRVVNGDTRRASPKTVARVREVVARLGYRPNPVGQALRNRSSRVVAMLAPNLDNPAMAAIAASTETALREIGYVMILCDTHDRADLQDEYLAAMRSQLVQGYVLVSTVRSPGLAECRARGEALVFVARRDPDGEGAFVGIDDRAAGAEAADYFSRLGVRDPAVIFPAPGSSSTAGRAAGFVERLVALGHDADAIRTATAPGLSHLAVGYAGAQALVAGHDWPDGLLCVSDLIAYGAFRLATEAGIAVPGRCRMVGIDDNALNAWITPWLSSVRVPYGEFGETIVAQLTTLWGGGPSTETLLPHRLTVR